MWCGTSVGKGNHRKYYTLNARLRMNIKLLTGQPSQLPPSDLKTVKTNLQFVGMVNHDVTTRGGIRRMEIFNGGVDYFLKKNIRYAAKNYKLNEKTALH